MVGTENGGYLPFTLAAEITALLAAADFADDANEHKIADYLRETADNWNANIERWCYITGTEISKKLDIEGYYVRISSPNVADADSPLKGFVPIKNRPPSKTNEPIFRIVSPDSLCSSVLVYEIHRTPKL